MKPLVIAAMIFTLCGCMTPNESDTLRAVEYSCASAAAALKTIIVLNDKLSVAQRANVTRAVAVVDPICSQKTVPTLDSTQQAALTGALTQLTVAARSTMP